MISNNVCTSFAWEKCHLVTWRDHVFFTFTMRTSGLDFRFATGTTPCGRARRRTCFSSPSRVGCRCRHCYWTPCRPLWIGGAPCPFSWGCPHVTAHAPSRPSAQPQWRPCQSWRNQCHCPWRWCAALVSCRKSWRRRSQSRRSWASGWTARRRRSAGSPAASYPWSAGSRPGPAGAPRGSRSRAPDTATRCTWTRRGSETAASRPRHCLTHSARSCDSTYSTRRTWKLTRWCRRPQRESWASWVIPVPCYSVPQPVSCGPVSCIPSRSEVEERWWQHWLCLLRATTPAAARSGRDHHFRPWRPRPFRSPPPSAMTQRYLGCCCHWRQYPHRK